jgi:hypothetical protein
MVQTLRSLVLWHMDRFYNNRGMTVNILTATNTGNNRRTTVSIRPPVNIPLWKRDNNIGKLCFLCGLGQANARNNRTSIARQRSCKHAYLQKRRCFPWCPCKGIILKTISATSQFSVGDSHGKFVVEEELEVGLWRLNVFFEDFMCAVVQWYLECDSYSSCVKIRCQKTDRGNFAEE